MTNYIYVLHCPIANTVRYVGKSVEPEKRLKAHISAAKTFTYRHHTSAWIRKLLDAGLSPILEVVAEVPRGGNWQKVEREWISGAEEKGWKLTNSTAGGEGLDYLCPLAQASYRANLSAGLRRYWAQDGKKEAGKEHWAAVKARPGMKEKIDKARNAALRSPEYRNKMSELGLEIQNRPELKEKLAQARRDFWASAEGRAVFEKAFSDPEVKRKQSEAKKKTWADPEARQRMANRWTPEAKGAQAAEIASRQDKMKASITPEVLEKRNAAIKASWARRKAEKLANTPPT